MNRRERRRAAKLGDIVEIKLGRVVFDIKPGDDVSRDICFVCGKPATAWSRPGGGTAHGFASVNGQIVLLCEDCFNTEEKTSGAIVRKYWNAPDLKISEGATPRRWAAIALALPGNASVPSAAASAWSNSVAVPCHASCVVSTARTAVTTAVASGVMSYALARSPRPLRLILLSRSFPRQTMRITAWLACGSWESTTS